MFSMKIYGAMLHAYPKSFRDEFGAEMRQIFADCCREAHHQRGGMFRLWLHTAMDTLRSALYEHLKGHPPMIDSTAFEQQLVSTLDFWSKALREGYSVKQVILMLVKHAPEPTATAFQSIQREIELGKAWPEVMTQFQTQLLSEHWRAVLRVVDDQFSEGGNFADRLDGLSVVMQSQLGKDGWSEGLPFED